MCMMFDRHMDNYLAFLASHRGVLDRRDGCALIDSEKSDFHLALFTRRDSALDARELRK
jgi:hypothetical protein